MKIAISVWNDYISSAFDFAHRFLLGNIENDREIDRSAISRYPESIPERIDRSKTLGVDVPIRQAISLSLFSLIEAYRIQVLPYIIGSVDEVLKAYLVGQLGYPRFAMLRSWLGAPKGFSCIHRQCRR